MLFNVSIEGFGLWQMRQMWLFLENDFLSLSVLSLGDCLFSSTSTPIKVSSFLCANTTRYCTGAMYSVVVL